jgi:8-oxo-dGTP diphosphatase
VLTISPPGPKDWETVPPGRKVEGGAALVAKRLADRLSGLLVDPDGPRGNADDVRPTNRCPTFRAGRSKLDRSMKSPPPGPLPRLGASVVLWHDGAVLLVRRKTGPYADKWSLPGGHVTFGERMAEAAKRELREETGIDASIGRPVGIFEIVMDEPRPAHFVLMAFSAQYQSGEAVAADDAADVRWVREDELGSLDITPQSRDAIARSQPG